MQLESEVMVCSAGSGPEKPCTWHVNSMATASTAGQAVTWAAVETPQSSHCNHVDALDAFVFLHPWTVDGACGTHAVQQSGIQPPQVHSEWQTPLMCRDAEPHDHLTGAMDSFCNAERPGVGRPRRQVPRVSVCEGWKP